jgi:hypothetical protein
MKHADCLYYEQKVILYLSASESMALLGNDWRVSRTRTYRVHTTEYDILGSRNAIYDM